MDAVVTRLYPPPAEAQALSGLYLRHDLRRHGQAGNPYIYSNFIISLDGRISLPDPKTGRRPPPAAIRHPHDWRLYLELAAQADAVLISGRRLRELCADASPHIECVPDLASGDLAQWRRERGLAPQPACLVLSRSLDFPASALARRVRGDMVVIAGAGADCARHKQLTDAGIAVATVANSERAGDAVRRVAAARGYRTVYSIAGPEVLYALIAAGRMDRLYTTFALRLLAGHDFDTLLWGDVLAPPFTMQLLELYVDPPAGERPGLLLATVVRSGANVDVNATPVSP